LICFGSIRKQFDQLSSEQRDCQLAEKFLEALIIHIEQ